MLKEQLKAFGASIKNLPPEERKVAGIRFKELKRLETQTQTPMPKKKHDPGEILWSLHFGGGGTCDALRMYEKELHIGRVDGVFWRITGENLEAKRVKE